MRRLSDDAGLGAAGTADCADAVAAGGGVAVTGGVESESWDGAMEAGGAEEAGC